MKRLLQAAAATVAASLALTMGGAVPAEAIARSQDHTLANTISKKVTLLGVARHLFAYQSFSNQYGGTRAPGTPGFEASAAYTKQKLVNAGYEVTTQEFPVRFSHATTERLIIDGVAYPMHFMLFSKETPVGGVTGKLIVIANDDTPGCEAEDFAKQDFHGAIVLVQRGICPFAVKQANAADAGAAGVVFYNNVDGWLRGSFGNDLAARLPSGGISMRDGESLLGKGGTQATLEIRIFTEARVGHTLVAQTKTGRTDNIVVAGAHLDSVVEGPGMNTNATGAAALLETAIQLGPKPKVANAIRFIFWGSWEFGIVSAPYYMAHLTPADKADMAMYLNFDGIASPNGGYFIYAGTDAVAPPGSAAIQQAFADFYTARGIQTETVPITTRFEHLSFTAVGVPSGGIHTGLIDKKTDAQVAKWGGTAGVPFDTCYHEACDNLTNVNWLSLAVNAKAIAYVTTLFGASTEGAYYVPNRSL